MAEEVLIPADLPKAERYKLVLEAVRALLDGESNRIARLSNATALLHQNFNFLWTGFYLVEGEELVLGPFQGPVACMRIAHGKGVCGTAWKEKRTIVVPDVDAFPGHIACSADSRSEIVIPMIQQGQVFGVLDIDSTETNFFDATDQQMLEQLVAIVISA